MEGKTDCKSTWGHFVGWWKCWYLDCGGGGFISIYIYQNSSNCISMRDLLYINYTKFRKFKCWKKIHVLPQRLRCISIINQNSTYTRIKREINEIETDWSMYKHFVYDKYGIPNQWNIYIEKSIHNIYDKRLIL